MAVAKATTNSFFTASLQISKRSCLHCWCASGQGAVLYRWAYCRPAFAVSECDETGGPRTRDVIVCSCNVLTDHDVRSAAKTSSSPKSTRAVYRCLGCRAQCGRCARTIRKILKDARLREAPKGCFARLVRS